MAANFAEYGTPLDLSTQGQRVSTQDFSSGGTALDLSSGGTALAPAPAQREDSWAELGRKALSNAVPIFKQVGGSMLTFLTELPPQPPAGIPAYDPQWQATFAKPHKQLVELARDAGALPGEQIYADATADLEANAPNVDPESLKGYAYDITQGIIQMVPAIAASMVAGPGAGASVIGTQVFSTKYEESRRSGRSTDASTADAVFYGFAEGLPEMIPLGILMKPGQKFLSRTLRSAVAEGVQEIVTEALQSGYDAGVLDEHMTWGEAAQRLVHAGIVGAGVGGGLSVATHPFVGAESPMLPDPDQHTPDEVLEYGRARFEALDTAENLSPEEQQELDFLRQNRDDPNRLAATYGINMLQPGQREQSVAETPPLSQEDIESPIPNDLIQKGRETVQDALGAKNASEILSGAGFPSVGSEILVTQNDGTTMRARVSDAYIAGETTGVKLEYEDGSIVSTPIQALRGRVAPSEAAGEAQPESEQPSAAAPELTPVPPRSGGAPKREEAEEGQAPDFRQPEDEPIGEAPRTEAVEQASPEPTPPPGDRWTSDRGAIPGEPIAYLDGDSETAAAAIVEIQDDQGGITYEATDSSGNLLASESTIEAVARRAEAAIDDARAIENFESERVSAKPLTDEKIEALRALAEQAGWAQRGGLIMREGTQEEGALTGEGQGEVTGRTPWIPRAEWWPGRPGGYNEAQTEQIIEKGIAGKKLGKTQQDYFDFLSELADQMLANQSYMPTSEELSSAELDASVDSAFEVSLVARAAEIDEDAVEEAAKRYEDDDAGFLRAIHAIVEQDKEPAAGGEVSSQAQETDLLGDDTRAAQALADETRARDDARNSGQASSETGDPSDLFSQARQQTDLVDAAKEPQSDFEKLRAAERLEFDKDPISFAVRLAILSNSGQIPEKVTEYRAEGAFENEIDDLIARELNYQGGAPLPRGFLTVRGKNKNPSITIEWGKESGDTFENKKTLKGRALRDAARKALDFPFPTKSKRLPKQPDQPKHLGGQNERDRQAKLAKDQVSPKTLGEQLASMADEAIDAMVDDAVEATGAAETEKPAKKRAKRSSPRKRNTNAQREQDAQRLSEYFTPGNVVKSYSGWDRVLSFDAADNSMGWEVTVEAVEKKGGDEWVSVGDPRTHTTLPSKQRMDAVLGPAPEIPKKSRLRKASTKAERTDVEDKAAVDRTSKEIAKSLGYNLSSAGENALKGLTTLFGGNGKLNSGLTFDPETYAKAKPHFEAMLADAQAAGKDLSDFIRSLVNAFGSGIKPYLRQFAADLRNENAVSDTSNLERNRGDAADTTSVDQASDESGPGRAAEGAGQAGVGSGIRGGLAESDARVLNGGATTAGERSDQSLRADEGQRRLEGEPTGADDASGSRGIGDGRVQADRAGANEPEKAAGRVERQRAKLKAQTEANFLPVVPGSKSNINETLPYLLPGQREDVKKTEDRFAKPDGYGMLFTNGTGTGKTFTGLGVARRFVSQGKSNILIIAPSDKIISDWIESGVPMGLEINRLRDTRDAGKEVTITTYANMRDNDALATRQWDLVISDEAHYLLQGKDGLPTAALGTLRAITMHPDGGYQRAIALNRKTYDRIVSLQAEKTLTTEENNELKAANDLFHSELEKIREQIAQAQGEARPRVLFLSATPFAYEKSIEWANGYLFDYSEGKQEDSFRGYNIGNNRAQFFVQHFGYRIRYNRLTEPDAKVDRGIMQRQFNTWLKKQGVLSARVLDVEADYDRKFILIDSKIGARIDALLDWVRDTEGLSKEATRAKHFLDEQLNDKFDHLSRRYLLESIKAEASVDYVRKSLALGRKVVVFHDYKKGGGFNPFNISEESLPESGKVAKEDLMPILAEYQQKFSDVIESDIGNARSPIKTYKAEFPDVLLFNGDVPPKQRRANVAKFNDDDSGPQVLLAQSAAGREGISLHDVTGTHRRVLLNLGLPTQPTTAIQQEGRIYRTGQVSDAMFRYMNTGTSWEKWAFATTIAQRASAAENLAQGEQARALKDAFIAGFEEADVYPPGTAGEGTGGKERDKAANEALSEFDRAVAFYWGTQKKTARTKAKEGKDYFATPEPVGLKMVEWAGIRPGEDVLEPSAGHGAIARWIRSDARSTAVEPSGDLAARLAMVFDGEIKQQTFEDLHIVNKYDAIIMNPPFGSAGRTAIDHLDKAVKHLRDRGRVIAIIPEGAGRKKFEKWYEETDNVYLAGELVLPSVTFERAATKVSARIVILDKVLDAEKAPAETKVRDLSNAEDSNELFKRIEDMEFPARAEPIEKEPAQKAAEEAPEGTYEAAETVHAKTGEDLFVAKVVRRMPREEYLEEKARAKRAGGYYSSYKAQGAIPGFQFKTAEARDSFINGSKPDEDPQFSIGQPETVSYVLTDEARARYNAAIDDLRKRLDQVGISDRVTVAIRKVIKTKEGAEMSAARGRYFARTIDVAMRTKDKRWTLDHEIIHALRDMGMIRPAEWSTLVRAVQTDQARMDEVRERRKDMDLSEDKLVEEAIADLHADWNLGRRKQRGFIKRAFQRINDFMEALGNAWRGQGFQSAGDIFRRIDRGEVGARPSFRRGGFKPASFAVAYHGSPHVFSEFGLQHIGKGEGFQAYGWGLYFAEKEAVAKGYRSALTGPYANSQDTTKIIGKLPERFRSRDNARKILHQIDEALTSGDIQNASEYVREFQVQDELVPAYREAVKPFENKGGFYEVYIPDSAVAKMVDWDAMLNNQPEIMAAMQKIGGPVFNAVLKDSSGNATADNFYRAIATDIGGEKAASEALRAAGIPGIKYFDSGSRGGGRNLKREYRAGTLDGFRDKIAGVFSDATDRLIADAVFHNRAADTNDLKQHLVEVTESWPVAESKDVSGLKRPYPEQVERVVDALTDEGTRNLVLFDASIIKIKTVNGEPVTAEEAFDIKPTTAKFNPKIAAQISRSPVPEFNNKESEARWKEARKGVAGQESWLGMMQKTANRVAAGFSRHFIDLPNEARFSPAREQLRKIEAAPQASKEEVVRTLKNITEGMSRDDLELFTRKVVLDDLSFEVDKQHQLPFGFSPADINAELEKLDAIIDKRPDIQQKIRMRQQISSKIANDLVAAGVLHKEQIKNPAYYRHQVLDYARAQVAYAKGAGKKLKTPHWARRMGSRLDINANLLEAEFEWMQKALTDIATARTIEWFKNSKYNVREQTIANAKAHNDKLVERLLAQDMKTNGFTKHNGKQTSPLNEEFSRFRQRIAFGFKLIRDAISNGELHDIPLEFQGAAAGLMNETSGGESLFPFLAWILDNNLPGSMGAAVAFKAINQRKAWVKAQLGDRYADPTALDVLVKRGFAPDGYVTWQPDEGKLLFTAKTIPEHVVDRMLERIAAEGAGNISSGELLGALESVRSMLAVGGPKYQMVLPEEVAKSLNDINDQHAEGLFDTVVAGPLRLWKRWVLINPRRVIKYNLNNLSGDLDAVIAGNPKALKHLPRAIRELRDVMLKGKTPSARYREAVERGVFDSGLTVQEIPDINYLQEFELLLDPPGVRKPLKLISAPFIKLWRASQRYTWFRENWLRYAAYLDYVERLEAGEDMRSVGYGAASKDMVDAIDDKKDRAALLARELVGDYGAVSDFGRDIRRKVIPFYSWMEINTKRYWRFGINAWSQGVGQGFKTTGIVGATLGVRTTAYLTLRMAMLYGMVQVWNNLVWGDEEDELGAEERARLHLILGRDTNGEVVTVRFQGALSDFLTWFGFSDAVGMMSEIERGRASYKDLTVAMAKAPVNKVASGITPVISTPIELLSGQSYWPDVFRGRAIKDRWRHTARLFSMEHEYDLIFDRPSRGYGRSLTEAVIYRRDPGETAYNRMKGMVYDWERREKGASGTGYQTPRSKALYDWRQAKKFGDTSAERDALRRMEEFGIRRNDVRASIRNAHPLGSLSLRDKAAFLRTLSPRERQLLSRSITWYEETYIEE